MLAVKICGITSREDARLAVAAGADAVGLVFWSQSPRCVDAQRGREIVATLPPFITRVGVFVNESAARLTQIAETVGLDVLQLHGDETPEFCDTLPRRVLKALHVGAGFGLDSVAPWKERVSGVLLDRGTRAQPGGTGESFDWSLVRKVRRALPYLVVAGGLGPANVAAAVAELRPDAVDVSSGVESTPGVKDPGKLHAFITAARAAASHGGER